MNVTHSLCIIEKFWGFINKSVSVQWHLEAKQIEGTRMVDNFCPSTPRARGGFCVRPGRFYRFTSQSDFSQSVALRQSGFGVNLSDLYRVHGESVRRFVAMDLSYLITTCKIKLSPKARIFENKLSCQKS